MADKSFDILKEYAIDTAMFTTKLPAQPLITPPKQSNSFLAAAKISSAVTTSGNGARKYTTTGNSLVDQFSEGGRYKTPRSFEAISHDCELLWAQNPLNAVKFALFCRIINRETVLWDGHKLPPQKGFELKHEAIMRMIWLQLKVPQVFWDNVHLLIAAGSWHDIFTMLQYDLVYNGWNDRKLSWNNFKDLLHAGLQNPTQSELIKKYLPGIKAKSDCTTVEAQANNSIAKWVCSWLFGPKGDNPTAYKAYRKFKSGGAAHTWQRLISQKKFNEIDFGKIHGRALSILVKSKFLTKTGLSEKYSAWVAKPTTEVKFTGFVHELFQNIGTHQVAIPQHVRDTVNKQFQTLVKKGGEKQQTKFIVVRDTSGSMGATASGTKMSCYNVAKALALYFSEFLTGTFANSWIEFNSSAKLHSWKGKTPIDKWCNDKSSFIGSTNFQSVIDLFVSLKKGGISEEEFPTGILCISDNEFNLASLNATNREEALNKLSAAGFSKDYVDNFTIILWNLTNSYYGREKSVFETPTPVVPNFYYMSGYSGAIISFITDKIKNAEEVVAEALDQELLSMVKV